MVNESVRAAELKGLKEFTQKYLKEQQARNATGLQRPSDGSQDPGDLVEDNLDSDILWLDHKSILVNNKNNVHNSHDDLIHSISKIYKDFDIILIMTNRNSKNIFKPLKEIIEAS